MKLKENTLSKHLPLFFYLYIFCVLILVFFPINTQKTLNNTSVLFLRTDYFLHAILFIPWMFFIRIINFSFLSEFLLGIGFASATEGIHYFLPYRTFNLNDLIANISGIIIGIIVVNILQDKKQRNSSPQLRKNNKE